MSDQLTLFDVGPRAPICISCGSPSQVYTYVFEQSDGRLFDRPLCRVCAPPTQMLFEEWLDWAQHRGFRSVER